MSVNQKTNPRQEFRVPLPLASLLIEVLDAGCRNAAFKVESPELLDAANRMRTMISTSDAEGRCKADTRNAALRILRNEVEQQLDADGKAGFDTWFPLDAAMRLVKMVLDRDLVLAAKDDHQPDTPHATRSAGPEFSQVRLTPPGIRMVVVAVEARVGSEPLSDVQGELEFDVQRHPVVALEARNVGGAYEYGAVFSDPAYCGRLISTIDIGCRIHPRLACRIAPAPWLASEDETRLKEVIENVKEDARRLARDNAPRPTCICCPEEGR